MHEIVTEIKIDASPDKVWGVLTDFARYPEWNPFIRQLSGEAVRGHQLTASICPPGGRAMTFRPKVLVAEANTELRWLGRLLIPGLFDREHYFLLSSLGPDQTRFIHGEKFSGVLVPLLKSQLESGTRAGFEAMNQALKSRAESA
jgi:Uncharacterized conserved protein